MIILASDNIFENKQWALRQCSKINKVLTYGKKVRLVNVSAYVIHTSGAVVKIDLVATTTATGLVRVQQCA